ncbi:MAG: N-acetylmuramoyl-L-alanine amidase [Deltaproteobacteria bacterium]|nr:MAG: N-acetylmuramoyl-L-alanine amidase [Deltaproteobacteria bacterium]
MIKKGRVVLLSFLILSPLLLFPELAYTRGAEDLYQAARGSYYDLKKSGTKRKYRHNWFKVIDRYIRVTKEHPKSEKADDAWFMVGELYQELYQISLLRDDLKQAIESYRKVVEDFPASNLADDAQFRIGEIYRARLEDNSQAYLEYSRVVSNFPKGDQTAKARYWCSRLQAYKPAPKKQKTRSVKSDLALVSEIRHNSNPDYTRVVIDVEKEVAYKSSLLPKDPEKNIHFPRLYLDLKNAKICPKLKQPIPIGNTILKRARAGQYQPDTVRVVLDIESIEDHAIFHLEEPFRIIVDVWGEPESIEGIIARKEEAKEESEEEPGSFASAFNLKVKKIIIDPGHGGHDPGAIGKRGLKEKDVVLSVSKLLEKKLKERLDIEVSLTRRDDTFIPLDQRAPFANTQNADLFISIHANASPRRAAYGVETYYLSLTNDEEALKVAARENATSTKKISDLQYILADLILTYNVNESPILAKFMQESLVSTLKESYSQIKDLGVKKAPFYVLINVKMPAVLVELSFISNPREEKRLRSERYQEILADGIFQGIKEYIEQTKSASL